MEAAVAASFNYADRDGFLFASFVRLVCAGDAEVDGSWPKGMPFGPNAIKQFN